MAHGDEEAADTRGRVAIALAGLAIGVASAGAFVLPRLQTSVPVAPQEPPVRAVEPGTLVPGKTCRGLKALREDL